PSLRHKGTRPLVPEQGENAPNGKLLTALGPFGVHLQPLRHGPKGKGKGPPRPGPTGGRGKAKRGVARQRSSHHGICGLQCPEQGGIRNNSTAALGRKRPYPLGHRPRPPGRSHTRGRILYQNLPRAVAPLSEAGQSAVREKEFHKTKHTDHRSPKKCITDQICGTTFTGNG